MSQKRIGTGKNPQKPKSHAARLFDIRLLIGCLFTLYGLMLIAAGLIAPGADMHKADGININLWMGAGMLAVGLIFLAWHVLNPLQAPKETEDRQRKSA